MAIVVMASIPLLIRPRWLCSCTTTTTSARLDHGIVQASQNYQVSLGEDDACVSAYESQGNVGVRVGRRDTLAASAVAAAMFFFSVEDSEAAESGGFLSKYLKRKKLDPLDTYVPTVVLAQLQFQDAGGKLVGEKPEFDNVRSLLRSGPAGSLRTDIRAVAQYASEAGEGKSATEAVDQCLSALEDLDSLLLRAARSDTSASVDVMKTRVSSAVTALDKLLATVPSSILEKGKAIATAYRDQSVVVGSDENLGYDESRDQLKGLL